MAYGNNELDSRSSHTLSSSTTDVRKCRCCRWSCACAWSSRHHPPLATCHLPLATCHLGRDCCCAQLPLSNACRYRLEVSTVDIYDRRQWGCCATSCGEADNVISVHLAPWRVGVTPSSVALLGEQGNNANSSQASWVRRAIRVRDSSRFFNSTIAGCLQ